MRTIPTDPDGYQKWLSAQRQIFEKRNTLLETMFCIQPEQLLKIDTEEFHHQPWKKAFDERMDEEPTHDPGSLDSDIDFMYLFDLDLEVFSIDHCAHYRLDKIPQDGEWMRAIFEYDEGHRFVHPRLAPSGSLADLTIASSDFSTNALGMWNLPDTREVKPKTPNQSVISRVRWEIFKFFQMTQQDQVSVNLLGWTANSLPFREMVFFIICVAAGGKNLALVDKRRILEPDNNELYLAMISGCKPNGNRELVSSLGVGYHMQDQPMGSSPNASKYWFEGVLICLVPRLNQPGVFEKGLAEAIRHGRRENPHTTFNGLLVSIEHLVLFRSFLNGEIEYSPLMPLISIGFHRSMDAQQRYGSCWLDDFDTRKAGNASGTSNDNDDGTDARNTSYKNSLEERQLPKQNIRRIAKRWTVRKTFLSLVNLFECTALDRLKPKYDNGGKLPTEVITIILNAVSDVETYNACREVSRGLRSMCDQRPLLIDDVALRVQPLNYPAKIEKMNTRPSMNSQFHAWEISTGRPMNFKVLCGYQSVGKSGYQVVVGSEWNRKSFVANCPIHLAGLDLSPPWENKAPSVDCYPYVKRLDQPVGELWDEAFERCPIAADSKSETLGRFWQRATETLLYITGCLGKTLLQPLAGQAWLMPPNTRHFITSTRDYFHPGFVHLLYVRSRRASKFWNTLWEDFIHEAKESLEGGDESIDFEGPDSKMLGTDNPFVMLIVGFEIRLFRWKHGAKKLTVGDGRAKPCQSGVLTEFELGRIYIFDDAADREAIERFLYMVAENLKRASSKEVQEKQITSGSYDDNACLDELRFRMRHAS